MESPFPEGARRPYGVGVGSVEGGGAVRRWRHLCELVASLLAAFAICKLVNDFWDHAEFILDTVYNVR